MTPLHLQTVLPFTSTTCPFSIHISCANPSIPLSPHPAPPYKNQHATMHSAKLTIALIISATCGLVTAQFGDININNFSCPNAPHTEGRCVYIRYNTPDRPKSGAEYYVLDSAVEKKPGVWNCGFNLAKCCHVKESFMSRDTESMADGLKRLCENPAYQ
ncbi:uncharacterized protein PGTG_08406 [Puccinia graminis f. sp. tritici CRL 75-36-700-3]|uniref:Uncharacterized protein n=1 Tax=Puccinia graminis f. sp. tritici (strain CRL 75-36-700-3 / race SCCL) TaxID=418459 RepID=E3KDL4_PUCGT|nr:uncharacterized protein PGTG_08406 [Puccinia graminis f. sp. tritici CRL 75-36-700-3]EFP82450.2 hypothetical protein PGTG_08406 [Puccinia graminis f. sp. tritici CRL 75-36-700-3]